MCIIVIGDSRVETCDDYTHEELQILRHTNRDWLLTLLTAVLTLMIFVFAPLQAAGVFVFQTFAIAIASHYRRSGGYFRQPHRTRAHVDSVRCQPFRLFLPSVLPVALQPASAGRRMAGHCSYSWNCGGSRSLRERPHHLSSHTRGDFLYLLIAVIFATLYAVIGLSSADAFKGIVFEDDSALASSLFYLSFVPLTSTGYGDIVPIHPLARSLCNIESIVGQLYPATILARLVTLELATR